MSKKSRDSAAAGKPVMRSSHATKPDAFTFCWGRWLAIGALVIAALAAYWNSFSGPFIFDDLNAIVDNPTLRHPSFSWQILMPSVEQAGGAANRPLVNLSLALNYAWGGLGVRGYHAFNFAIHLLAGLALFGIVRRTLGRPGKVSGLPRLRGESDGLLLALSISLLWTVHPLLTESVTCVVQRTESLMGLFYLLTLYFFIRGTEGTRLSGPWFGLSVAACLLGMATKEVMVSAPLIVLLYDRTFLAGSFREAWRQRRQIYLGLCSTWLLLAIIVIHAGGSRGQTAGFGFNVTPWTYALTQCRAVVLYLKLSLWPNPLVVDYGQAVVTQIGAVAWQAGLLLLLLVATVAALVRRPVLGFLGAWFFVILAPSSSIVPLVTQTIAEHRMYLPLAAIVTLLIAGGYGLLSRLGNGYFVLMLALSMACIMGTARRNGDYRSSLSIWSDTVAKCPGNERAHLSLGNAWVQSTGSLSEAMAEYRTALLLKPDYAQGHYSLGNLLLQIPGRLPEAIAEYQAALRLKPLYPQAHFSLGNALLQIPDRLPGAIAEYQAGLRLKPDYAEAHNNLGVALSRSPGRLPEAISEYEAAARLKPDYAEAYNNLGLALARSPGRLPDAIAAYQAAVRIKPDYAEAYNNLGLALMQSPGRLPGAIEAYQAAVRLKPDYAQAHRNLGVALAQSPGRGAEAMAEYQTAVKIEPGYAEAHFGLGNSLAQTPGRMPDAIGEYETALRLKPDYPQAHFGLGNALQQTPGRVSDAISEYREALRLKPDYAQAHNNLGLALARIPGHLPEAIAEFQAALAINPGFSSARANLARAQAILGQSQPE